MNIKCVICREHFILYIYFIGKVAFIHNPARKKNEARLVKVNVARCDKEAALFLKTLVLSSLI